MRIIAVLGMLAGVATGVLSTVLFLAEAFGVVDLEGNTADWAALAGVGFLIAGSLLDDLRRRR